MTSPQKPKTPIGPGLFSIQNGVSQIQRASCPAQGLPEFYIISIPPQPQSNLNNSNNHQDGQGDAAIAVNNTAIPISTNNGVPIVGGGQPRQPARARSRGRYRDYINGAPAPMSWCKMTTSQTLTLGVLSVFGLVVSGYYVGKNECPVNENIAPTLFIGSGLAFFVCLIEGWAKARETRSDGCCCPGFLKFLSILFLGICSFMVFHAMFTVNFAEEKSLLDDGSPIYCAPLLYRSAFLLMTLFLFFGFWYMLTFACVIITFCWAFASTN